MVAFAWTMLLVPITAGVLSFALVRWLFPGRCDDSSKIPLTAEEKRSYLRWTVWPVFLAIPLSLPFIYAWYLTLTSLAGLFLHTVPGMRYLVQPDADSWLLQPAFLLGLISSSILMQWFVRRALRDHYPRYRRFSKTLAGYDNDRAFGWLAALSLAGAAVWFMAGTRSFATFDETGIEFGRPFAFRTSFHSYTRVVTIEHRATYRAMIRNIFKGPHYVIVFDDGSSWSTRDWFRRPVPALDRQIAAMVARKSGRWIVERP